jgi:hypothetical protein
MEDVYIDLKDVPRSEIEAGRLTAVHDGFGQSATWTLFLDDADGDYLAIINWPPDWPNWMTADDLRQKGFRIHIA